MGIFGYTELSDTIIKEDKSPGYQGSVYLGVVHPAYTIRFKTTIISAHRIVAFKAQ